MNTREFVERYSTVYEAIGSLFICFISIVASVTDVVKHWSFYLIWPICYFAIVHDIGYKGLYKAEGKKIVFIIFFLIPWFTAIGFCIYGLIIKLG